MARKLDISRDDATRVVARVLRERLKLNSVDANAVAVQVADMLLANSPGAFDAPCSDRQRIVRNSHERPFVRYAQSLRLSEADASDLFAHLFDTLAHDFDARPRESVCLAR